MALEASIVERLQELRKWQIDQEERLLKLQQEQRELLSIEQERMYEALGLSMKDIVDESIIDEMSVSKIREHLDAIRDIEITQEKNNNNISAETPNISKQRITTSKNNSPILDNSVEQLNTQLNTPDECLKIFDTDLTVSDSSNYKNLPECKLQIENNNQKIGDTPKRFCRNNFENYINGIEVLAPDNTLTKSVLIDEIPVPSPKKDFTTLLEEKLQDEAVNANNKLTTKNPIKKPFLRKGEGLARFRINSNTNKVEKPTRPRNTSQFINSPSNKSQRSNTKNIVQKPKVITKNKKFNEISRKNTGAIPSVAQQKLILSNVGLPKKTLCNTQSLPSSISSSISPTNSYQSNEKVTTNDESNQSDLDTSKLETKMFEMLEEKADNSSFCSTSSTVIAFMQQSTPLKLRNIRKNLPTNKQITNHSVDRAADNVLNEIVQTLDSNKLSESSIRQSRGTNLHKNVIMSKWDSGPFTNENHQPNIRNIQQNSRKMIVQSINHKSNQFQHNNNEIVKLNYCENKNAIDNVSNGIAIESVDTNSRRNELNNSLDNNCKDLDEKTGTNISMHVRFAEYDEYKTIGLTDTSTLSNDSRPITIYDEEKNWIDHSESEESSDSEIISLKEELINSSQILNENSKLTNPLTDQYNDENKNYMIDNKIMSRESDESTEDSESNSTDDQSTDDEHSVFNDSDGTYYDDDANIPTIRDTMGKVTIKSNEEIDSESIDTIKSFTEKKLPKKNDTIFKSDLLKNRLLELEKEIDIFRKENTALKLQRQQVQDEQRQLQREFKEKMSNLERERNQMNISFQEERKRLSREKAALENRLRDAREKSIQSKHEREEMQMLNEQLHELKEDMIEKEGRWQAAQARQRSQVRVLQMENSKLKSEIERLREIKRLNTKSKRSTVASNTKAIHQINKQLDSKRSTTRNRQIISDEELETAKISHKKNSDVSTATLSTKSSSPSNVDTGRVIVYNSHVVQKPIVKSTDEIISKKRHVYETLLKDASLGYHEYNHENPPIIVDNDNDNLDILSTENYESKREINGRAKLPNSESEFINSERISETGFQQENKLLRSSSNSNSGDGSGGGGGYSDQCVDPKLNDEKKKQIISIPANEKLESQSTVRGSYHQFVRDIINPRNERNQAVNMNSNSVINTRSSSDFRCPSQQLNYSSDKIKSRVDQAQTLSTSASINKQNEKNDRSIENDNVQIESEKINYINDQMQHLGASDSDLTPRKEHESPLPHPPDYMTPRPEKIQLSQISNLPTPKKINSPSSKNQSVREVKHPDGHTEYWYPNGNVKRVYPDRNITKMIYFNGDVRETTPDGCIKYFYATTKTWHTKYPDGFEILEFPDGQQERRTKDGIVEVSFPDGSVRLMQPDGIEKWALPNGTIAEIFPNGEKILTLPDGQREVHTSDHKRREFPDGTVKFVYPNGMQETRYVHGRIRIKDKDGNLVMDSFQT